MPGDIAPLQAAQALGSALAVGLLVGLERGWRDRDLPDGGRVAGLRTFALIALCGGLAVLLAPLAPLLLPSGLLAVAALFAVSFPSGARVTGSVSITTAVAALATFALGALAAAGHALLAVGAAVLVALLLDLKPALHGLLRLIRPAELNAVLQLGVLSAVVLPLLPDAGYGPYEALNPFKLWLAVLLLAALSLAGHIAMRWRGTQQGLLWIGVLGGLASSTAATLALARCTRTDAGLKDAAAAATVAACGVMFLRMALLVAVLQPALAWRMGGFLAVLGLWSLLLAAWQWRRKPRDTASPVVPAGRVFDLPTALGFGALLGAVGVAVRAAKEGLGVSGLYGVAFLSGLADVDPILVSTLQMQGQDQLAARVAAAAMLLAATANMGTKAAMAWSIGGRSLGTAVLRGYGLIVLAGAAGAAMQGF